MRAGTEIFRIHQHRRRCSKCKEYKFIKGGKMRRAFKSASPMANVFCCVECK